MEGYAGVSEKDASGSMVVMAVGSLVVGTDAVAVVSVASAARYYDLRYCLWDRSVFVMEVTL